MNEPTQEQMLKPYVSPLAAWALSLGTTIGWGALVVTSSSYLSHAGPLGSVLGTVVGMLVMFAVARNYHYLMGYHPDAGGIYAFSKSTFDYDRAFLIAWFAILTYLAIFWANATSVPLFARYFIGDVFKFGYLYTLFGYEVYFGEVLLVIAAVVLFGVFCSRSKRALMIVMVAMAFVIVGGITACFVAAMLGLDLGSGAFNPAFLPDSSAIVQVVYIACISPWAFIGFENISHSAEEFKFSKTKSFSIMVAAIVVATALYAFVTLLSVTAYPAGYESWFAYIADLGNISGIEGLPAFYAAHHYLGDAGLFLLGAALLALVVTSLIGNLVALSRLVFALGRDEVMPRPFAVLNCKGIPQNAVVLIVVVSLVVPFMGRTAIGWIVDVTTIGAALLYCSASYAAFKVAMAHGDTFQAVIGIFGFLAMLVLEVLVLFVLPDILGIEAMGTESYLLFTIWAILGFAIFAFVIRSDPRERFNESPIVWVALLALVLLTSLLWLNAVDNNTTAATGAAVQEYLDENDVATNPDSPELRDARVVAMINQQHVAQMESVFIVMGLFGLSLFIMLSNNNYARNRRKQAEQQLGYMKNVAYTDALTGVKSKHAYVEYERNLNDRIDEGEIECFSVVVCDLNDLKIINDTKGHKVGDEHIQAGGRLVCVLFKHSPVFRIGGDEFAVILQGSDYERRHEIMDEFNRQVEEGIAKGDVVVAAGMSDYEPGRDKSVRSVFDRADVLMYERKQALKSLCETAGSASS